MTNNANWFNQGMSGRMSTTVYHGESQCRVNVFCHLFVWILNWRGPFKGKEKGPLKTAEVPCVLENKEYRISPGWMVDTRMEFTFLLVNGIFNAVGS